MGDEQGYTPIYGNPHVLFFLAVCDQGWEFANMNMVMIEFDDFSWRGDNRRSYAQPEGHVMVGSFGRFVR